MAVKTNGARLAKLSSRIARQVSRRYVREMAISKKPGFNEQAKGLVIASRALDRIDGLLKRREYGHVLDLAWSSILELSSVKRAVDDQKSRIDLLRRQISILSDRGHANRISLDSADRLVLYAHQMFAEDSAEVQFIERGRSCVVQAIAVRRAALDLAKQWLKIGDWDQVKKHVDVAFDRGSEVDDILECMEKFLFPKRRQRKG